MMVPNCLVYEQYVAIRHKNNPNTSAVGNKKIRVIIIINNNKNDNNNS